MSGIWLYYIDIYLLTQAGAVPLHTPIILLPSPVHVRVRSSPSLITIQSGQHISYNARVPNE